MARSNFAEPLARHTGHIALTFVRRARWYRELGDRVMCGYYVRRAREAWSHARGLEHGYRRPMGATPREA